MGIAPIRSPSNHVIMFWRQNTIRYIDENNFFFKKKNLLLNILQDITECHQEQ
jgi:hypothetical protein